MDVRCVTVSSTVSPADQNPLRFTPRAGGQHQQCPGLNINSNAAHSRRAYGPRGPLLNCTLRLRRDAGLCRARLVVFMAGTARAGWRLPWPLSRFRMEAGQRDFPGAYSWIGLRCKTRHPARILNPGRKFSLWWCLVGSYPPQPVVGVVLVGRGQGFTPETS